MPQKPGWITRLFLTITTLALVIIGFFFLTALLIAGALIALVVGVRLWWTIRKLKRAQAQGDAVNHEHENRPLDGEYVVIERESSTSQLPPAPNNTPPAP